MPSHYPETNPCTDGIATSETAQSDGAHLKALIAKYDRSGPRYTSYPTALQFSQDFGESDYSAEAVKQKNSIAPLSIYVHIPFCGDICYYCACNKIVTKNNNHARTYLNYLRKEIELQSQLFSPRRKVTQLHWGGGTPTFLDSAQITELMHITATHFSLQDDNSREYSIEIDPRTVEPDTIALLKGLGFNRLSLGVQDFEPQVQQAINRLQPVEMVRGITDSARSHQFKSVSYDLIYGLPLQSVASFERTLREIIALSPDRIACYNYAHMPHRFKPQRAIDRLTLPSAEEKLRMLANITAQLIQAGYVSIGMDHFVKPTDDLAIAQQHGKLQRNFQGYTTCLAPDLIGIGVSAISTVGDCYAQNRKKLDEYYQSLDQGHLPIERGLKLNSNDKLRRFVIMQLICHFRLRFDAVNLLFNIDSHQYFANEIEQLKSFEQDGLVVLDEGGITVTEQGRSLIRHICLIFDSHNQPETPQDKHFSKIL
jgi:oxygen-independent coproporphyrinogen-3 oxidase